MRVDPLSTVAIILLAASPAAAQMVNPANGHTYFASPSPAQWTNWRAMADATGGGYLVSIGDASEQAWVVGNSGHRVGTLRHRAHR